VRKPRARARGGRSTFPELASVDRSARRARHPGARTASAERASWSSRSGLGETTKVSKPSSTGSVSGPTAMGAAQLIGRAGGRDFAYSLDCRPGGRTPGGGPSRGCQGRFPVASPGFSRRRVWTVRRLPPFSCGSGAAQTCFSPADPGCAANPRGVGSRGARPAVAEWERSSALTAVSRLARACRGTQPTQG
jgi:hypothetical protein